MTEELRLGIVGCGAVARQFHIPALPRVEGLYLSALIDTDPDSAAAAADLYRSCGGESEGIKIASRIEEVLADVDAAVVSVPAGAHASAAELLLARGKAVLVEKPMAGTLEECDRIIESAEASGSVLGVGHMRRLFPSSQWLKGLLNRGALGEIQAVTWAEGVPYDWPALTPAMFSKEAGGGGVLADMGSHVLDLLLWWFGPHASVVGCTDNSQGGVESDVRLELGFPSFQAVVELSWVRTISNVCTVVGSKATALFNVRNLDASYTLTDPSGNTIGEGVVPLPPPVLDSWTNVYAEQLRRFAASVRGGASPYATGEDGRRAVALISDCYKARMQTTEPWVRRTGSIQGQRAEIPNIAVTGASGFIGGRLTEDLVLNTGARVTALVRDYKRLARLATLPPDRLRFDRVDLDEPKDLKGSFADCDVVIHAAYGSTGSSREQWHTTVEGTRAVVEAAKTAGVGRLIHISSMVVYDYQGVASFDEQTQYINRAEGDEDYAQAKLAAERIALEANGDLEVVVLQPTIVYGPWGPAWTMTPLMGVLLHSGLFPTGKEGVCNAVYIDDVVQAITLATSAEGIAGERMLISGPQPTSWGEFYDAYRAMVGVDPSDPPLIAGRRVTDSQQQLFTSGAAARIDRARELLGYNPQFDLKRGMALVARWLRWFGDLRAGPDYQWPALLRQLAEDIQRTLPDGAKFILADENQLSYIGDDRDLFQKQTPIRLQERGGQYWGPPENSEAAVQALETHRKEGAEFLVIAWPAFWWVDYYEGLAHHLRTHARRVKQNDRLMVFDLRK